MQTASSAKRTWSAPASASECTATVAIPSSRQARITRMAISPRFAIRTFLNKGLRRLADHEELLAVLDALAVLDQNFRDRAGELGFDFVHQLHGFDDAERLAFLHAAADLDEVRCLGRRSALKGADERLFDRAKCFAGPRPWSAPILHGFH